MMASSLAFSSPAHAQVSGGFAVNNFAPSERGSEWFALDSLDIRGQARPAVGLITEYAIRPLVVYDDNGNIVASIVRNLLTVHPGASLVLWERLRLGVDIPVQLFADGHAAAIDARVFAPPAHHTSFGDIRLSADVRLAGQYGDPFTIAIGGSVWLPTGERASYSGDSTARGEPRVLFAGDVGDFAYAASVGVLFRDGQLFGESSMGTNLTLAASMGLRFANRKLLVGPEVFGSTVVSNSDAFLAKRGSPVEGLLGAHYLMGEAFRAGLGAGTGLARGYGAPSFRSILSLEWVPQPPKPLPPPQSTVPADRDGDGIVDGDDACPDVAGVRTGETATNGCPRADRDHDGVADQVDACPDTAGVASADTKKNGCPADTDGDSIVDSEDACPEEPGLRTSDSKTNGCPDPDRDKDLIPNMADACPDQAGVSDPDPKRNGCPRAFVKDGQIRILDQVKFATGSAQILPGRDSEDVLDAVLQLVKAHPEMKGIRIEGHTDNRGTAAGNMKLSKARAASVLKWLVAHGLDAKMLQSEGRGQESPLGPNDTDADRANNRRVEFHILDASPPVSSR